MQLHGSKYFARRPPPPSPPIPVVKIQLFQNMVMFHIKLKETTKCSSMIANIWPADPSPTPWPCCWGQKVKIKLFQNMVMFAYQIKENHKYSNMVANNLPKDPYPPHPLTLGLGSKGQNKLFHNMVMLHIKLKRIKNAATW